MAKEAACRKVCIHDREQGREVILQLEPHSSMVGAALPACTMEERPWNQQEEGRTAEEAMYHKGNLSKVKMAGFSLYRNLM